MRWGTRVAPAAFALDAPNDAWTAPFLREVGEMLALGPVGAGLLVEELSSERRPLLVASDPWVERIFQSASARVPVRLLRVSPGTRPDPPRDASLWTGFVAPFPGGPSSSRGEERDGENGRKRASGAHPVDAANPALPLPLLDPPGGSSPDRGTWAGIQSHWFPSGDGRLRVRIRFMVGTRDGQGEVASWQLGTAIARAVPHPAGSVARVMVRRSRRVDRREWFGGSLRRSTAGDPFLLSPRDAADLGGVGPRREAPERTTTELHSIVLGASGSGKSGWLADLARRHIVASAPVVVLDLHGDLAPAIVGHLPEVARQRVIAIDSTVPDGRIPGVAVLGGSTSMPADREVAHVVASLRRLSVENGETYWGPRLERVFDTFVHAAQEEGGGLLDVHALLTDPRRRDACRLTTRNEEVARFLEELPAVLRRNPEFLWPAAARTAKLALDHRLARLVAPSEAALDVDALIDEGVSLLWRLPLGELGPEGAQVVANLILSRIYLGRTAPSTRQAARAPLLIVLDEAHAFSAPLLVEILSEGRKFGVQAILASQYPERLSPSVRSAAAGAVGSHVLFRIPHPAAAAAGQWAGLSLNEAQRILPVLPPGVAVIASYGPDSGRRLLRVQDPGPSDPSRWAERVAACALRYGSAAPDSASDLGVTEEAILLALLSAETTGRPLTPRDLVVETQQIPTMEFDPAEILGRIPTLVRRGWVVEAGEHLALTEAGSRRLGLTTVTGAVRESAEHRALLLLAFRIFARHHVRLEILRQGRFDTRLPDARVILLPDRDARRPPADVAARLDRLRTSWVWRAFGGRDVHVEAEVTGAERTERLRRGVLKAQSARAFPLFLVGDARRAARVRGFLHSRGLRPRDAQVWTLTAARAAVTSARVGDG